MAAASPGRGEDFVPHVYDEAADITYLTVGFWRRSAKPGPLSFLVLHSSETFVLLSEEPWKGQQVRSFTVSLGTQHCSSCDTIWLVAS